MWFESLVGFREESPAQVRGNLTVDGEVMVSSVNGRSMRCGLLETPTLAELRSRVQEMRIRPGTLHAGEVVGDAQSLHTLPDNAGAMFQVASQFNLLEMVGPAVTPEQGVGIYEHDRTQGPACAIACGAGTIYRNYFIPVGAQIGQTRENQIDCLKDMGDLLGNESQQLWTTRNGYALPSAEGLNTIGRHLSECGEDERDRLRAALRIGLHWRTDVTIMERPHEVTQAYCSALPVAYSSLPEQSWEPFARLVLEAAYEATLAAAVLNLAASGSNKVYLTLLGGGAFGNSMDWILSALRRAISIYKDYPLAVSVVSYRTSNPAVRKTLTEVS